MMEHQGGQKVCLSTSPGCYGGVREGQISQNLFNFFCYNLFLMLLYLVILLGECNKLLSMHASAIAMLLFRNKTCPQGCVIFRRP